MQHIHSLKSINNSYSYHNKTNTIKYYKIHNQINNNKLIGSNIKDSFIKDIYMDMEH